MARGSSVSKSDLASTIAKEHGISKSEATAILATLVDTITAHVAKGHKVVISGFANFQVHHRKARMATNPQNPTGPKLRIAAKKVVKIRPLKAFKDEVL